MYSKSPFPKPHPQPLIQFQIRSKIWHPNTLHYLPPYTPTAGVETTIKIQNPHHSIMFSFLLKLHSVILPRSLFLFLKSARTAANSINHTKHVHPLREHLNNLFCVRWITESRKNNRETQTAPDTCAEKKCRLWYLYWELRASCFFSLSVGCYCRMT